MKIPKSFKLLNKKYTIEYDDGLIDRDGIDGFVEDNKSRIILQGNLNNCKYSDEYAREVFYHEAVHAILFSMGELELGKDERFVDGFSKMLNQFLETMEY